MLSCHIEVYTADTKKRTKLLLFFHSTKYFDKKVPKNMFFNIFCSFFEYSNNNLSSAQILCHFGS